MNTTQSSSLSASRERSYINQQNPYRERLFLGSQANVLTAVSDMILRTTVQNESFCRFHIKRGQILSYPLTEDQYIEASSYIEPAFTLELNPEPNISALYRFDTDTIQSKM